MTLFDMGELELEILEPMSSSFERIEHFLMKVDGDFYTPLSVRVDIETYSNKLFKFAVNIFLISHGDDVAHAGIYVDLEGDEIFISNFAVLRKCSRQKIGNYLLQKIEDYVSSIGVDLIRLEADCEADALFEFYTKNGFRCTQENDKCIYLSLLPI